MCPRCAIGYRQPMKARRIASKYESESQTCHLVSFLQETQKSPYPNALTKHALWAKIIAEYCGLAYVGVVASTCSQLNEWFNDESLWEYLCIWSGHFKYSDAHDELFCVYPGIECPESWRDYFLAHQRKIRWVQRYQSNAVALPSFLESYKRINNPVFGKSRVFATNDVYFIRAVGDGHTSSVFPPRLLYEETELIIRQGTPEVHTMRSGLVAFSFARISGDKQGRLIPLGTVTADAESALFTGFAIFHGDSASSATGPVNVMFADVAECIHELNLLSTGDAEPVGSTVSSVVAADCSQRNLPFEVYYCS
jgi:hypothetical protein